MTILGDHTVAEVDDLIAAKDIDMADFSAKRATLPYAPDSGWDTDWAALMGRYDSAKAAYAVQRAILVAGSLLVPNSMIDAEAAYASILGALYNQPQGSTADAYTDTVVTGGFQDLANRMLAMQNPATGAPVTVNESNIPQPTAPDADLNAFNQLGQLPIPGLPGAKGVPWWVWAGAGMVVIGLGGAIVVPFLAPVLMARRI